MKHIYVIGNGFDIDLGWRTSYKDFYDSKLKGWRVHFLSGEDCLPVYLLDHAGENWYDLERTIYHYCLSKSKGDLDEDLMNSDYRDYVSIKGQLERFVKERSSEQVGVKSKAYEILKTYVEWNSRRDLPQDMRSELISFNYTPLDKVAKQINPKVEFKYIPIHGTIEKNSCIFGFHNDPQIRGLYRDMQKLMDDNYDPGRITPLLMDAKSITFFGLSMGFIDAVYFKDVLKAASQPGDFRTRKTMDIEFITRDKQSKKDIKKNLQDIGIDFQALSTNNKVTFTLTSENK